MIERIFNGNGLFGGSSSSNSNQKSQSPPEDCFECRMVGGTGLSALGSYIMYYSYKRRTQPGTGKATVFVSAFLGSVIFTLGLLRLTGLHGNPRLIARHHTKATNSTAAADTDSETLLLSNEAE